MANPQAQRLDPIREKYFGPLERTDVLGSWIFGGAAILSIIVVVVEKTSFPHGYNLIQGAFVLLVLGLFVVGQVSRLYFSPRAEDKRREDFLSNALNVNLTHERTIGYYNNNESILIRKMGLNVLENTHFTKAIALEMVKMVRLVSGVYIAIWLILIFNRDTDLGLISAAAQAVFSEQVISRWLRMEWLRIRSENIFRELHRAFLSNPASHVLDAQILEAFSTYEASKLSASIVLSTRIFERLNPSLSQEWEDIKVSLTP
ncbi:hypothetical protein NK214_09450 [Chromobacterium sp. S0633]|uniref:hypothetical protein n=1 Tax=Chromobacterium sp. S0633 TaxID=2957805 RepID=UPI00209C9B60|nr:hypothetical protein [Chromobacterium sp. S0633]MCP1290411.1 hypothetical protein [Chromobacterium sp. S0633]